MKKIGLFLGILRAFVRLVGNPKRTEEILLLAGKMHRAGLYEPVVERLKSDAKVSAMFTQKWVRGYLDLTALAKCGEGTLGNEFQKFVTRNNLDPNFFYEPSRKIENDHDYYEVRLRETHDIWHVVLGVGTDEPGELHVQGFMIAQFSPPLSAFLAGGAFFRVLFRFPAKLFSYTQALSTGFQTGAASPQFFGEKWEECWSENLDILRARVCKNST